MGESSFHEGISLGDELNFGSGQSARWTGNEPGASLHALCHIDGMLGWFWRYTTQSQAFNDDMELMFGCMEVPSSSPLIDARYNKLTRPVDGLARAANGIASDVSMNLDPRHHS